LDRGIFNGKSHGERRTRSINQGVKKIASVESQRQGNVGVSSIRRRDVDTRQLSGIVRWAAIPVRSIVGYGFMSHGVAKIMNLDRQAMKSTYCISHTWQRWF
jgi:hypothetical protein